MRFSCVISAFSLTASAWQDDATSLLQAQVQKNMDREGCLSEKCKPSPKTITTTAEVVTTLAPVVTTPAPAVTTPAPAVTTPAPAVTTPAPVVTTPAPVVTTPAPVVNTPAPVVNTPAPVVNTPAPVVSTPAPLVNTPPPVSEPRCTAGDPDAICTQLRDGQQWDNDDLLSMYSCLATNCVDQTGLWDGVTCEHALESLSCSDAADLSGHDPSQQLTKFTGTVADACPRSCKAECAKCPAPVVNTPAPVVNTPAPVVTTPAPEVRLPPDQLDEVPDGCKGFENVQEDCTNKDLFILKKDTNGFVKPTFKPDQYGSDEIWETVKVQDSEWKGTCIAYVNTRGGTCKTFCESNGMKCVRAMDDAHMQTAGLSKWLKTGGYNPTDCTLLPSGHTRQSQTENGCNQRWGTQMCACN